MALNPFLFEMLNVADGGWTTLPLPRVRTLVTGTAGKDDIIFAPSVATVVNAGDGDDHIVMQNGGFLDLLHTLNGGNGSDQIFGNNGIDAILGGNGNDYIVGGGGPDDLTGGAGIDTLSYETAAPDGGTTGVTVTLNASGGASMNAGQTTAGVDLIPSGFENVVGSNFNDTITGNAGNNVLIGLGGNDTINGGAGNDVILGGAGRDFMDGGSGNDTFVFADISDSTADAKDTIGVFSSSRSNFDTVDLSQIDADLTVAGNQEFAWIDVVNNPGDVGGGQAGRTLVLSPLGTIVGVDLIAHQMDGGLLVVRASAQDISAIPIIL